MSKGVSDDAPETSYWLSSLEMLSRVGVLLGSEPLDKIPRELRTLLWILAIRLYVLERYREGYSVEDLKIGATGNCEILSSECWIKSNTPESA